MIELIHCHYINHNQVRSAGYESVPDLEAALPLADMVCVHCPKTPETIGLFNATRLGLMKTGATIINTARGGLVEQVALHASPVSGHLGGAGLDGFA
jgi:D-3-phosphoglycerate dehydrogenase